MNKVIVIESCENIRFLARQALKGSWKPAIIACLVWSICMIVPTMALEMIFGDYSYETLLNDDMSLTTTTFVSSTYSILVSGAFTFGITAFFLDFFRQKSKDIGTIFSGFGLYFKTLGLYIVMSIFIALWTLLLIVPGIIATIRYSQAVYILADDPNKGIMQCINESKEMMKGNKGKFFGLQLSFIGWYLLAFVVIEVVMLILVSIAVIAPDAMTDSTTGLMVLTLSVVTVAALLVIMFLLPYIQMANTVFYEMVIGNLRRAEDIPPLSQETAFTSDETDITVIQEAKPEDLGEVPVPETQVNGNTDSDN